MKRYTHVIGKDMYMYKMIKGPDSQMFHNFKKDERSRASSVASSTVKTYQTSTTGTFFPSGDLVQMPSYLSESDRPIASPSSSEPPVPREVVPPLYSEVAKRAASPSPMAAGPTNVSKPLASHDSLESLSEEEGWTVIRGKGQK